MPFEEDDSATEPVDLDPTAVEAHVCMYIWRTPFISVLNRPSKPHASIVYMECKCACNILQLSEELHIPNLSTLLSHFLLEQQQSSDSSCDNPVNPNYP